MFKKLVLAVVTLVASIGFAFAQVDVNKADQAALDGIKGIGPSISKKIVDERKKNGDFKDWADFEKRVNGVGAKNAAKMSAAGLTVNNQSMANAPATAAASGKSKAKSAAAATPAAAPATAVVVPTPAAAPVAAKDAKAAAKDTKADAKPAFKDAKAKSDDKPAAAATPAAAAAAAAAPAKK